jgi:hypothetical protein
MKYEIYSLSCASKFKRDSLFICYRRRWYVVSEAVAFGLDDAATAAPMMSRRMRRKLATFWEPIPPRQPTSVKLEKSIVITSL